MPVMAENSFLYALVSVVVVSFISLAGIFTLSLRAETLRRFVFFMVSVAVGAFFGDALIHLIPESLEAIEDTSTVSLAVLAGIFSFFALEKFLHWHHEHGKSEETEDMGHTHEARVKPLGYLVLISDAVHNFIDGIVIGVSFLVSVPLGIATAAAIALHEIPSEISDFGLLLHAGFSKAKALWMNFLSAITAILGTILAFLIGGSAESFVPLALAFGGGFFIYIAGSDLVPELHKTSGLRGSLIQIVAILIGVGIMYALLFIEA